MASRIELDLSEIKDFFLLFESAAKGDFKEAMKGFMEGLGVEFLRIVQDEIIRRRVMDSRLLLASFQRGGGENIWTLTDGGLTLEIGTSVNYASYVNDGHWTNKQGVERRFVPGYWEGDRFVYDPDAKSGMVLKQKWVEGKHYWESALRILDAMYPELLEAKLSQWIDSYFG